MSDESASSQAAVRYWWNKALQNLEAGRRDLAAGDTALAINRAYSCLFYAASALLLERRKKFKKHAGVRAAFNRDVVKTRLMASYHGNVCNQLFDDRISGDYSAFSEFDQAYVEDRIEACEAFLADLRPMPSSL